MPAPRVAHLPPTDLSAREDGHRAPQKPRGRTQPSAGRGRTSKKQVKWQQQRIREGRCPHCGQPCAPYYECEERRAAKRARYVTKGGGSRWPRPTRRTQASTAPAPTPKKRQPVGRRGQVPVPVEGPDGVLRYGPGYLGWERGSPWLVES